MAITIRRLQPADCAAYRQTRLDCLQEFPDSFSASYAEEREKPELYFEARIRAQDAEAFMMGTFDGDALVGICGFVRGSGAKSRHWGELLQVYVRPAYAGRGLGRQLVRAALLEAFADPALEQIQLGVVADNKAANALYEGVGFREYGLLEKHWRVGNRYLSQRLLVVARSAATDGSAPAGSRY